MTATIQETITENAPAIVARLDAAMAKIGEWVEAGGEFAAEQAPELVNEIVMFEIASRGFNTLTGLTLAALGILFSRYGFDRALSKDAGEGEEVLGCVGGVFSAGVAFAGLLIFCSHFMAFVKPIVAPRLFLIEYFRGLVG